MAKSRIGVGVDDATGQPANAPRGPYITDDDDGTKRRKPRADDAADRARRAKPSRAAARGPNNLTSPRTGPAQP